MQKLNLVIGAGISGATIARLIAENMNEKVIVVDIKDHIGGNCYDYRDENGIMIHKYGTHIFHTNNEAVWQFLSRLKSLHLSTASKPQFHSTSTPYIKFFRHH